MTRNEFIHRAAIERARVADETPHNASRWAEQLADRVAEVAPFEKTSDTAAVVEAIDDVGDRLRRIEGSLDDGLPNAGKGS